MKQRGQWYEEGLLVWKNGFDTTYNSTTTFSRLLIYPSMFFSTL
jgi:hypothetical protein